MSLFILIFVITALILFSNATDSSSGIELAAGLAGGAACAITGLPFDYFKMMMQANENIAYRDVFRELRSQNINAIRTVARGGIYPILSEGISTGFLFAAYHLAKSNLSCILVSDHADNEIAQVCIAGAFAGLVDGVVSAPLEHLRLQSVFNPSNSPKSVQSIFVNPRLFINGANATILRNCVGMVGYFLTIEESEKHNLNSVIVGGLAGTAFWTISYPLDVIKSNIQKQNAFSQQIYTSLCQCSQALYREGGVRSFYKGFTACLIRSFPVNAAQYLVYSFVKNLFHHEESTIRILQDQ